VINYLFKHFPAPDGSGFDYKPRLIRQVSISRPDIFEFGEANIVLLPSDTDPWFQVEIVKILGAVYSVGNISMLKGDVISEVDPIIFAPYSFIKWDW
jgi:acetoacetate decarboxylase